MNIVDTLVEVDLPSDDSFLKVKETLTRMGIPSKKDKRLFQSCHILHKRGRYYIVHFKEMFALDGKPHDFTDEDIGRRNVIVKLLDEWNLVSIVHPDQSSNPVAPMSNVKIISHKEKGDWDLVAKYTIGKIN